MYFPSQKNIKKLILNEYHKIPYEAHTSYQELITALRKQYFWPNMKKEVVDYLPHCSECQ